MLRPLIDTDPREMGPYRLHQRIGAGGMGVVYLGHGPGDRPVAVKVPHEHLAADPAFRARFRAEVAAARHVRASSVAAVIDAEVDCARPWLATEYVPGPTLHAAVLDTGPLTGRQLDGVALGLAEALTAIHEAQVVHRDLKPANVILAWDGPKIIDFGVARSADYSGYTQAGELIGTIAWMSPEQLDGQAAGAASDVFAWACCLVFAATGRRPFSGESQEIVALRITSAEPDLTGVPDRLLTVVRHCLAKQPERRPSAAGLHDILSAALAPPTPLPGEPDPPSRRHPGSQVDQNDQDETRRTSGPTPLPPPSTLPAPAAPSSSAAGPGGSRPARTRPPLGVSLTVGLLLFGGLFGAVGVWAAGTGRLHPDAVGVAGATLVGVVCAQVLFPSNRVTGVVVTLLAAFTGSGGGVLVARATGVGQPGRVLLAVAGALVIASGSGFAMAEGVHRPAEVTEPAEVAHPPEILDRRS